MPLALCICKAPEPADIVPYFKGLATTQMREDNGKHFIRLKNRIRKKQEHIILTILAVWFSNGCGE